MDLKINLDIESLKTVYQDYKNYLIPLGIIFVCIVLLIMIILPQLTLISDTQQKKEEEVNKLNILNTNLVQLESINDGALSDYVSTVTLALPIQKNFESVLGAISSAANVSGVLVGDYQFQVGDISHPPKAGGGKFPSIEISLSLTSDVDSTLRFMDEIYRTVPLAEVKGVSVSGDSTTIDLVFFFKPLPPSGIDPTIQFRKITPKDKNLLNEIFKYNNVQLVENSIPAEIPSPEVQNQEASASATSLTPATTLSPTVTPSDQ